MLKTLANWGSEQVVVAILPSLLVANCIAVLLLLLLLLMAWYTICSCGTIGAAMEMPTTTVNSRRAVNSGNNMMMAEECSIFCLFEEDWFGMNVKKILINLRMDGKNSILKIALAEKLELGKNEIQAGIIHHNLCIKPPGDGLPHSTHKNLAFWFYYYFNWHLNFI
jgi:hypothetical protein